MLWIGGHMDSALQKEPFNLCQADSMALDLLEVSIVPIKTAKVNSTHCTLCTHICTYKYAYAFSPIFGSNFPSIRPRNCQKRQICRSKLRAKFQFEISYLGVLFELSESAGNTLSWVAKAKAVGLNPITRSNIVLESYRL